MGLPVSRNAIVEVARTYVTARTPFKHQGRSRTLGVDCAGLIILVAHELGLSDFDITTYTRSPDPRVMHQHLQANMDSVAFKHVLPGDVLWLRAPREQHLAIVSALEPMMMVHAYSQAYSKEFPTGRVVENSVDRVWKSRIDSCWRYRGVL